MSTEKQELLHTQLNVEDHNKENSSKLVTRERIPETPFYLIGQVDKWMITFKNYRITDLYETAEEALESIEKNKWDIIMRMTAIVHESMIELNNLENQIIERNKKLEEHRKKYENLDDETI